MVKRNLLSVWRTFSFPVVIELEGLTTGHAAMRAATGHRMRAIITYVDNMGRESQREITVHRVDEQHGQTVLRAFCHGRHQNRTFNTLQIVELVDLETGEVVEDVAAWATERLSLADIASRS